MSYASRDKYGMYKNTGIAGPGPSLMGADTLIGDSVVNANDEDLGDIKDIMLDMQTGQVAYAVLAFGGFLGMGEKLFAVPWQALHLDTINHRFVLDVEKEHLKTAPGFDKDAWPDMADTTWAGGIHDFYGTDPHRSGAPSMGPGVPTPGIVGGAGAGTGSSTYAGGSMGSSMGAGSAGSASVAGSGSSMSDSSLNQGSGASLDPRAGNLGADDDLSRIRGSNIG